MYILSHHLKNILLSFDENVALNAMLSSRFVRNDHDNYRPFSTRCSKEEIHPAIDFHFAFS